MSEHARAAFNSAIRLDPSVAAYWYERGLVYDSWAYILVAAENYAQALYLDPDHLEASKNPPPPSANWTHRATVRLSTGDTQFRAEKAGSSIQNFRERT